MVSLQARFFFRGMITLAVLLAFGRSSNSDEIVYSFDYRMGEHDSYGSFPQFDPSLGTLTGVYDSVSGNFYAEGITFLNTSFTDTVSFNGFFNATILTYAGPTVFSNSGSFQLPPLGEAGLGIGSMPGQAQALIFPVRSPVLVLVIL